MADELDKRLRLTVARMEAERSKAQEEKATTDAQAKALAAVLTKASTEWQKRIAHRVNDAVQTTNRMIREYGIQIEAVPTQNPVPRDAIQHGARIPGLPGIAVSRVEAPVASNVGRKRLPAQRAASARAEAAKTRLRIQVTGAGSIAVEKTNYKNQLPQPVQQFSAEDLTNEILDTLVANFVNEGVYGWPDEAEPTEPITGKDEDSPPAQDPSQPSTSPDETIRKQPFPGVANSTDKVAAAVLQTIGEKPDDVEAMARSLAKVIKIELSEQAANKPNDTLLLERHTAYTDFLTHLHTELEKIADAISAARKAPDEAARSAHLEAAAESVASVSGHLSEWVTKHADRVTDYGMSIAMVGLGGYFLTFAGAPSAVAFGFACTWWGVDQIAKKMKGTDTDKQTP